MTPSTRIISSTLAAGRGPGDEHDQMTAGGDGPLHRPGAPPRARASPSRAGIGARYWHGWWRCRRHGRCSRPSIISSASPPRTSPTMIRSGLSRMVVRTKRCRLTVLGCLHDHRIRRGALDLGVSSMMTSRSSGAGGGHLRDQRIGERGLARAGAADNDDVPALVRSRAAREPPWIGESTPAAT